MNKLLIVVVLVALILIGIVVYSFLSPGQNLQTQVKSEPTPTQMLLGGDRDAHGCIPSAGYSWCEELKECIRPWETKCEANSQ